MRLFLYILISLSIFSGSVWGMESPKRKSVVRALFSEKQTDPACLSIVRQVYEQLDNVEKGFVGIDGPWISDPGIITRLKKLANKGVRVVVNTSRSRQKVAQELQASGVHVYEIPGLHAKRLIIANKDPKNVEKEGEKKDVSESPLKSYVIVGSHNWTFLGPQEAQVMVAATSPQQFEQHYANQILISSLAEVGSPTKDKKIHDERIALVKSIIEKTPKKTTAFSTLEHEVNKAKIKRIKKIEKMSSEEDMLEITSMTFDDQDIAAALTQVADAITCVSDKNKIRLIVDRSALKHDTLLQQMHTAGVQIYVYNVDPTNEAVIPKKIWGKYPQIKHDKTMLRRVNGEPLVIVSTGNLTKKSEQEINVDTYYPDNEDLFAQIKAFNDGVVKDSTAYSDILKEREKKHKAEIPADIQPVLKKLKK